jgi:hypothetical protein
MVFIFIKVNRIGDYFVKHLFETRHRGAFELAYVGFTNMCQTFWRQDKFDSKWSLKKKHDWLNKKRFFV